MRVRRHNLPHRIWAHGSHRATECYLNPFLNSLLWVQRLLVVHSSRPKKKSKLVTILSHRGTDRTKSLTVDTLDVYEHSYSKPLPKVHRRGVEFRSRRPRVGSETLASCRARAVWAGGRSWGALGFDGPKFSLECLSQSTKRKWHH